MPRATGSTPLPAPIGRPDLATRARAAREFVAGLLAGGGMESRGAPNSPAPEPVASTDRGRATPTPAAPLAPRSERPIAAGGLLPFAAISAGDREVPVHARRHPRARRVILRVDAARGRVELVLPPRTAVAHGLRFLERKRDWIAAELARVPAAQPFVDGADLPLRGEPHRIVHRSGGGVPVERLPADPSIEAPAALIVRGAPEHLARRLRDWLVAEARAELTRETVRVAARLGVPAPRVQVRDTVSRWGSCSPRSGIAFSWRLVLAPATVRAYVVAHEVAHLREMNHSPRFWAIVEQLTPHRREAQAWLKRHGAALHRYGAAA